MSLTYTNVRGNTSKWALMRNNGTTSIYNDIEALNTAYLANPGTAIAVRIPSFVYDLSVGNVSVVERDQFPAPT